jgi:hypothetical protein
MFSCFIRSDEKAIWMEQCFRDVLKVTWGLENNQTAFHEKLPPSQAMKVSFSCCQQFILSRKMVHQRPLSTWKKLLHIVNEQDVCHEGEPDYLNLFAYHQNRKEVGPEPTVIRNGKKVDGYGQHTQGGTMEHLAHVVYGGLDLHMKFPTMSDVCDQFERQCPFSPCYYGKVVY